MCFERILRQRDDEVPGICAPAHQHGACLELGGKSPDIAFADADLDKAVPGAAMGLTTDPSRRPGLFLLWIHGHRQGRQRVLDDPAGEDHPGASGPATRPATSGAGPAA
ncbi:aldehyde dehydrogenase family protein [Rhodococcus sp. JVH1]|nr:aldehyde dehydrogenase [Rhodococcus sp. JVH1]